MKWLKIDEAAVAAGVSTRTIVRWINSGLRAEMRAGVWYIDPEALMSWRSYRAARRGLLGT